MADITFGSGADGAITVRLGPRAPDAAHRLLEQNGALALQDDRGVYEFRGDDAVSRAAQAAYLLDAGELTVETGAREDPVRAATFGADVVFARHPTEGIVAATATDATEGLVPDVLRQVGWRYDGSAPDRDIYLPPTGAGDRQSLIAAARASLVLQGLGLQVATVGLATPPASADRLAEAAEDLALEQVNLRTLTDSRDVADLLDTALDPKSGALPNLSQLLADMSTFIYQLPAEQGELLAAHADIALSQATALSGTLHDLQAGLADLGSVVEAPIATARSVRATAASAVTARGLGTGAIIQAAPSAQAISTAPTHAASI
ncbi:hypothetical protein ACFVVX_15500 [Kitasatospora sp. NPDC058170]|uniref:hypothetical protein n=1 Tax=Kitasatospora sp. NPDC058170 TaxID=3346364 RepID=UPI0036DA0627